MTEKKKSYVTARRTNAEKRRTTEGVARFRRRHVRRVPHEHAYKRTSGKLKKKKIDLTIFVDSRVKRRNFAFATNRRFYIIIFGIKFIFVLVT